MEGWQTGLHICSLAYVIINQPHFWNKVVTAALCTWFIYFAPSPSRDATFDARGDLMLVEEEVNYILNIGCVNPQKRFTARVGTRLREEHMTTL